MNSPFRKRLPPLLAAAVFATLSMSASQAPGAVPVIDGANLKQNMISAMENVAHTLKQIQQYKTQLQQYENMLQNTTAPNQQIWDAAHTTMGQLRASIDTLEQYKRTLGSIEAYLARYKNAAAYESSPCYSVRGCTAEQWAALKDAEKINSASQKTATDAAFKGIEHQQRTLQEDAARLERIQLAAGSANGQLQAIGYANQLASNQSNQLLQIRALLIAQQNIVATRLQAQADRESKEQAASNKHYRVPGPSSYANDGSF